jgi:hypothetical protein
MRQHTGWYCAIAHRSFCAWGRLGTAILLLLAAAAMPRLAHASPISFAQFTEASPGGNVFGYIDNGPTGDSQFGTSTGGPIGVSIPVTFTFLDVGGTLPADLTGPQAATLTMTSSSTLPVTPLLGVAAVQSINASGTLPDTITITRDTPAAEGLNGRTNLLSLTFSGQLLGALNSRTPQLSSDSSLSGNSVSYQSDFLIFNALQEEDFSLTFSSWTTVATGNGLSPSTDSYFASAFASGTGTFDATVTPVPEPATWLLGAVGVVLVIVLRQRMRKLTPAKCPVRRR